MDRLHAMEAFVMTVDTGSLSAAARKLGRSPAALTRSVASLEDHLGAVLLRRTTRSVKLTEPGERFLIVARRVLGELMEAEKVASSTLAAPQGELRVTAPLSFGSLFVRPLVDAYARAYPDVRARFLMLDRVVNLVDEGIDVAVRIAHMPDSALVAVKLGDVRRVVCASPAYLAQHGRPKRPADLVAHRCISFSALVPTDTWTFGAGKKGTRAHRVRVQPFLTVNTADAAIASAREGNGITAALSYQIAADVRAGALVPLLRAYDPAPVPVHLVCPAGSTNAAKVRAFIDLAVPRLRQALAELGWVRP